MAIPSNRYKILPLRGLKANLDAGLTDILEGEMCYATDEDQYYQKESGVLVGVGGAVKSVNGQVGDVILQVTDENFTTADHAKLDGIEVGAEVNTITSVNGETGDVVIQSFSGDYVDLTNTPTIPTNNSELANDSNFITAAEAPVQVSDIPTDNADLTNGASYITAAQAPVQASDLPTAVSELANDANYITAAEAPVQITDLPAVGDGTISFQSFGENAAADSSFHTNQVLNQTITLPQTRYTDLSGTPALGTAAATASTDYATAAQGTTADSAVQPGDLSAVATSGGYSDLVGTPTIPIDNSELVNGAGYITDYTVTSDDVTAHQGDIIITESQVSDLGSYLVADDITGKADLVNGVLAASQVPPLAVAEFKGSVADEAAMLSVEGEPGDWVSREDDGKVYVIVGYDPTQLEDWTALSYPTGFSGAYEDLTGKPDLFDGAYNSLSGKPTIPTNNNQLSNGAGYITGFDITTQTDDKYLRSNTADTATHRVTFSGCATNNQDSIASSTGSQGSIEVFNTGSGNDAFMSFHVGADYAIYFGLDGGTNKLSVGGWSMGAVSYEIYHSGNKPSLSTLGFTGASNANYITNNNQLSNGAGYTTYGDPAILTNGTTPSLNSGISAGEIRSLIGAGTSSFNGAYSSLSGKPTIPTNNSQLSNGAGYVTSSGNTVIGTDADIDTSGATIIDNLYMTDGVITSHGTRTLTLANLGYTGATNANYITNNNQLTNGASYATQAYALERKVNSWVTSAEGVERFYFASGGSTYVRSMSSIYFRTGSNTTRFTMDTSGNFTATGNVTAYSDSSLKENIEIIPDALDKVSALRGVTYNRTDIEGRPRHAGVIAQEVEAVLPEVVDTDENGVKSVAYGNMVGLLIESIKELKAEIETLKAERN